MAVIHINFRDREFLSVKKDVIEKLLEWGLDPWALELPKDAIACALDEVKYYIDAQERLHTLLRLEDLLALREAPL
ncbi:hypothetical protein [Pseudobacteriovorax antillogorgiicola]|uniref:Uncharacterized protein n=1 Tax=Pseudobacteriovorax antillogorgiicola TaxID=1513793 RepID=A0A1Y6CKC0_9BACT|nr:hypothetical protein [Pseudobacteriovorax antillogorgiicola]TCS45890.1 hypothetical protein EDD56_12653 [Pseudobacteriovorax antillogorgiicola]SMF71173.1 hypothetical protein SAMN06296036_12645 [Pseudobacteriovorax antillogorgiicola]